MDQRLVVLRPVDNGVKRLTHVADLEGMVMLRSPRPQLVPFKPHQFGKQRLMYHIMTDRTDLFKDDSRHYFENCGSLGNKISASLFNFIA